MSLTPTNSVSKEVATRTQLLTNPPLLCCGGVCILVFYFQTENHKWQKVASHWSLCPSNGCSNDVCQYIRSLYSHSMRDMRECSRVCRTCSKVVSWMRYHLPSCRNSKNCPYYDRCQRVKNNLIRHRIVGCFAPRLPPTSPPGVARSTPSLPTPSTPLTTPRPSSDEKGIDFDFDCTPQALLRGSFPEERAIYTQALEELLPEGEEVSEQVDRSAKMREALLQLHKNGRAYTEGQHWRRLNVIGHGGAGTAYCIEDINTSIWLAMKEEDDTNEAINETCISLQLSMLLDCQPPHIVEFYGASILPNPAERKLQLFLELMPACMQGFLYSCGPLPVEDAHNYAYQLFDALDFLHSRANLIHSDLKPANLLVDSTTQRLKVADFGCARVIVDDHDGSCYRGDAKAGTLHYNPPEFYREFRSGFGMDVWQAGCCFLAMVTGRRPWRCLYADCKGPRELKEWQRQQIQDVQHDHMIPSFLEPALQKLLRGCLTVEYTKRLTVKDCLKLLADCNIVTPDYKRKWLSHLVESDLHDTPSRHYADAIDLRVDVYLGSHFKQPQRPNSYGICLMPGWLGCISYYDSMTYKELLECIKMKMQVTKFFSNITLHIADDSPHSVWEASCLPTQNWQSTMTSDRVRSLRVPALSELVDPSKAVVISLP